jgi:hypothetical protein
LRALYEFVDDDPITSNPDEEFELVYTKYPVASLTVFQERLICDEDIAVAVNPVGVEGLLPPPPKASVVAEAVYDLGPSPFELYAATWKE